MHRVIKMPFQKLLDKHNHFNRLKSAYNGSRICLLRN
jgi:hypothetical protein